MNRRLFFDLRRIARTAGEVVGAVEDVRKTVEEVLLPAEQATRELALIHVTRAAMATTFEVVLPVGTADATPAAEDALGLIERLEDQLTVYREESEVSQLNRRAFSEAVALEERLYDLLRYSAFLSEQTEGAFDITAGPLIKLWGFFQRKARLPSLAERTNVLRRVGYQKLEFNDENRTIRFSHPQLEINLGSIGKGYALDRAGELLRKDWKILAGLLHGGHSSVYSIGADPRDPRGWSVAVQHPWDSTRRLAEIYLRDRALATSAATFQHLEYNNRKLGHVLDPRSGWPAEGLAQVTVLAPTAALADALSTAFFIQGVTWTRNYCAVHPEIGVLLLPEGERVPVVLNIAPKLIRLHTQDGEARSDER